MALDGFLLVGAIVAGLGVSLSVAGLTSNWESIQMAMKKAKYSGPDRWRAHLNDDDLLVCEACDTDASEPGDGIIVNKPVDPSEPVSFDEPTQVLCQAHINQRLGDPSD